MGEAANDPNSNMIQLVASDGHPKHRKIIPSEQFSVPTGWVQHLLDPCFFRGSRETKTGGPSPKHIIWRL